MEKRSFWQYCTKNWSGFVALAFLLFIGIYSYTETKMYPRAFIIVGLMGVTLLVLVGKSIHDWKKNG